MSSSGDGQVAPGAVPWGVVVPVKRLDVAKSRLAVLGETGRRALALAFAEDVVLAALACPEVARVLVVTDDDVAGRSLRSLGADVVPDAPAAGLNAALAHGVDLLRRGARAGGVVAVSADLPALRPGHLASVLRATRSRAVVADAGGTGTTILAAAPGRELGPSFGALSLARHVASGAEPLPGHAGARRDVDTPGDLGDALRLGVGARTAAVVRELGPTVAAALVAGGVVAARSAGGEPVGTDPRRSPRQGTMLS